MSFRFKKYDLYANTFHKSLQLMGEFPLQISARFAT